MLDYNGWRMQARISVRVCQTKEAYSAPVTIRVVDGLRTRYTFIVTVQVSLDPMRSSGSEMLSQTRQYKRARQTHLGGWCSGGFGGSGDGLLDGHNRRRLARNADHRLIKLSVMIPWPEVAVVNDSNARNLWRYYFLAGFYLRSSVASSRWWDFIWICIRRQG